MPRLYCLVFMLTGRLKRRYYLIRWFDKLSSNCRISSQLLSYVRSEFSDIRLLTTNGESSFFPFVVSSSKDGRFR